MTAKTAKILAMLQMQEEINVKVNPNWRQAANPWYRAIWIECAEMLDYCDWTWWKKEHFNVEQLKLEVVDVWHFAMSALLSTGRPLNDLAEETNQLLSCPAPATDIKEAIERLALSTLQTHQVDLPAFAGVMEQAKLSLDELFRLYTAKHVLNGFRQDHGYREGRYIKTWNGKQDNEHLAEIMTSSDIGQSDFATKLYQRLEERYSMSKTNC